MLSPDTITASEGSDDHVSLLVHCEQMVLEPLTVKNCLDLFQQIDRLGLQGTRLRERVLTFVVENYVELATTSNKLLEIPERTYREVQIQFNLYVLQQMQSVEAPKPLQAFLTMSASSTPFKSPKANRRSAQMEPQDQMDVND